jgi:hypothetical protein
MSAAAMKKEIREDENAFVSGSKCFEEPNSGLRLNL